MLKKLLALFIINIFCFCLFFNLANANIIAEKDTLWQQTVLLEDVKDAPIVYTTNPLIYSYEENGEIVLYKNQKEWVRAPKNLLRISQLGIDTIGYHLINGDFLHLSDGTKIKLPKNTFDIFPRVDFSKQSYDYYIICSVMSGNRETYTIINSQGEIVAPNDSYDLFGADFLDENYYLVKKYQGTRNIVFHNAQPLVIFEMQFLNKVTDNKDILLVNDLFSLSSILFNFKTDWFSESIGYVRAAQKNLFLANPSELSLEVDYENLYKNSLMYKNTLFKLEHDKLIDITPINIEFILFIDTSTDDTVAGKFFVKEMHSPYLSLLTLSNDYEWGLPEMTPILFADIENSSLSCRWEKEQGTYFFHNTNPDEIKTMDFLLERKDVVFSYNNNTRAILQSLPFTNSDGSLLFSRKYATKTSSDFPKVNSFSIHDNYGNYFLEEENLDELFIPIFASTHSLFARDYLVYKKDGLWFFLNLVEKQTYPLSDIESIQPSIISSTALYTTKSGQQGLLSFKDNKLLELPNNIVFKQLIDTYGANNSAFFIVNDSGKENFIMLTW